MVYVAEVWPTVEQKIDWSQQLIPHNWIRSSYTIFLQKKSLQKRKEKDQNLPDLPEKNLEKKLQKKIRAS